MTVCNTEQRTHCNILSLSIEVNVPDCDFEELAKMNLKETICHGGKVSGCVSKLLPRFDCRGLLSLRAESYRSNHDPSCDIGRAALPCRFGFETALLYKIAQLWLTATICFNSLEFFVTLNMSSQGTSSRKRKDDLLDSSQILFNQNSVIV